MPDLPKSPVRAKVLAPTLASLSLACLMMSPAFAQDSTTQTPAPAQIETQETAPATPAPATPVPATPAPVVDAPVVDAPAAPAAGTTAPAATAPATPAETAPAAAAPSASDAQTAPATQAPAPAEAVNGTAPAAAAPAAASTDTPAPAPNTAQAPAAPANGTPAEVSATEPAPAPVPFEPDADSMLPESIQRMIAPVLESGQRDPNLPHDLSPVGMFMAADIVVKAVMIGLAIASVVTWTVLVMKLLELGRASGNARSAARRIENAASLAAAVEATGRRNDPASRMIKSAMAEVERSTPALDRAGDEGTKDRVGSLLSQIEANASRNISRGTGVLATIGSTAPFVGLFGTVWGIMNSFISISESQTTNLAVVAPGIAEALLATAIGLVAAIPAVVIYNVFARAITGYRLRLANASAGVQRLVSRDLDFRQEA